MKLILLGAPGAGKGTQAEYIKAALGVPVISTGNLLREAIAQGTPLGQQAKSYMDGGHLVPDELIIGLVKEKLHTPECEHGAIFDGFPRTITQAEALKQMLAERGTAVSAMLELSVPEEMLMERLINRGKTSGRADDNAETIRKRLEVYHSQTAPLAAWYAAEGKLHAIKGYGALEEINAALCGVIDNV